MRIQNACAPPPRTAPIEEPLRSVRRTGVMEAHEGGAPTSPALMDPLSPSGPLAAAVSSSARLRGAASFVLSQVSGVESLARTDRPGSRAAARVMEEGTMKVFVFDPLNVDALAELLGRRDGGQVLSEGRAAIANGWRLVFGGQSKKWGCSVASLIQAPGERVQAARPRTAIMTRHQLPVVLGEDEAAYGFVLRLELRELAEYERTRHSRRHYDRISLRVLARQRDGRSFAEETCVAYVLRPEAMKLFTAPSSAYLDALRATLRAYWQLHGLVVRDGTGRQILDWEEPHGTIQYEDNEPLKPLLVCDHPSDILIIGLAMRCHGHQCPPHVRHIRHRMSHIFNLGAGCRRASASSEDGNPPMQTVLCKNSTPLGSMICRAFLRL